jgi:hypothetical protein
MIETRESPSLTARIETLAQEYQQRLASRQRALQQAQQDAEEALRLEGAISELNRLQSEIWEGKEDDHSERG